MEQLLEALRQQFDEATIQKGQELLEDILDIVNQNGEAGYISGNLYYSLMNDELQKFVDENEGNVDEYTEIK
jgi:PHD/YefM family antitoxin component YafN of YafNO toxin-antitoxin module